MTAAPPSRDASSAPGSAKVRVKLSQGQMAAATDGSIVWNQGPQKGKPIGVQEMARRTALIEANGGKVPVQ